MSDVEKRVKEVISDMLGVEIEKIQPNSTWTELKADSLDMVELFMVFEEEFQIEVPDADAEKIQTVQEVITYIEKYK